MIKQLYLFFIAVLAATVMQAQPSLRPAEAVTPMIAGDTTVSFVNFYPGSEIYELEGHSALRVTMPEGDFAISYGTYDFDQPNFVYRFVKGETDYWVTVMPWPYMVSHYLRDGRRIVEHRLNMRPEAKRRLVELIGENLREENRTYRYNYVLDNCATRPLRIVERALGDSIILGEPTADVAGLGTFRDIMRRYHRNYPWYQFGIDLALGSGIDRPIDNRMKAFAPVVLDAQLGGATYGGKTLVKSTAVLNDTGADAAIDGPTTLLLTPMAVSMYLLVFVIVMTIRDIRRGRVTRWLDAVLFGVFGLTGLLLTFLIFVSVHEATSPNWLYLWLNPLCLIPTIFIWLKKCKTVVLSYQIVNFVAIVCLAVIWPLTHQSGNAAFVPLALCDLIRSANYIYLTIREKNKK